MICFGRVGVIMRILYVTDDRSQWRQGNYYLDYLEAFRSLYDLVVTDLVALPDVRDVDLIVVGHGGQDLLIDRLHQERSTLRNASLDLSFTHSTFRP